MGGFTGWARGIVKPLAERLDESDERVARTVVVNFGAGIVQGLTKIFLGLVFEKLVLELGVGLGTTLASLFLVKDAELKKDLFELGIRLLSDLPNVGPGEASLLRASIQRAIELARQGRLQEAAALLMSNPIGGTEESVLAAPPAAIHPAPPAIEERREERAGEEREATTGIIV